MTTDSKAARRARLQRECDVSTVPVWLLLAACTALVLMLGLNAPTGDADTARSAPPAQTISPSTG